MTLLDAIGTPDLAASRSVLVVDDRDVDRGLLAMLLAQAGYRVVDAATAEEALELASAQRPDLVISDIFMPSMNGLELVRILRSTPGLGRMQVAFCTAGYDEREVIELARACGVRQLLPKPWDPDAVLAAVAEMIGRPATVAVQPPRAAFDAAHLRVLSDTLVEKVIALELAQEQLKRVASIVASSYDGIFATDAGGIVVSWNPAAESIYGYAPEAIVGRPARILLPPERKDDLTAANALRRHGKLENFETVHHRMDGTAIEVAVTLSPIADARGEITGYSTTVRDVSEQKRLEEQLRQAQKLEVIGQLSGGIAHDFNNMLAAISGFAELLLRPDAEVGEREREYVEEILAAGERSAALTRQLLAFSRKRVVQPRLVDLNAVVLETQRMLQRLIGEHIELATRLDSEALLVHADPDQLSQVLLNLVVNARDAMPRGGRIAIETSGHADAVLTVSDTGNGIDPEISARLFEPFFTTKEEGTGLGLANVRAIVEQCGGRILVESEPGIGTAFTVVLPRAARGEAATEPPRGSGQVVHGRRLTILLAEDEAIARSVIGQMLESYGHTVVLARDGAEALELANAHRKAIDLVMTDAVMPEMSGQELAAALHERWPELPVLFTSGYFLDGARAESPLAASAFFIQKPFSLDALGMKLDEISGVRAPVAGS